MILCDKFGQHIPLNRQVERFALEGVPISLSTAADAIGSCCHVLDPLLRRIEAHTFAAERVHGDDTTVPVLAAGKTDTGRIWTYVRDDAPFGGPAPPSAMFYYSRDRAGEHPQGHLANYSGILQADAYTGYTQLYLPDRSPGPIYEAACWAHARRPFFALADLEANARRKAQGKRAAVISPVALKMVQRIDALFEIERHINGQTADERRASRQQLSKPLIDDMEIWMREQRAKLSRDNDLAKAFDYLLNRWESFTRFLDDGRICLSNNCAERSLRGVALGRKAWLFAGSDRGGQRAAAMYSLIVTAKLNRIDPQAWLADVLARIADQPVPVGTMVTHRPPVRSVRAALPHTAPIGCCDGKPSIWMRMHQAARWQVFAKQPLETLPRQPVSLAPTHQSVSPSATNFPAESSQSSQIVWHRMVVQIPL